MMQRCVMLLSSVILCCAALPLQATAVERTEIYFSPEDHVDKHLIGMIEQEDQSIHAAVYCMMHRGVAQALMDASKRGVRVELIVDPYSTKMRSPVGKMAEKGIHVSVWDDSVVAGARNKYNKPIMHDKFCIFGDHSVWTGSFNFTQGASLLNRENVVVLHDPQVVMLYQREFEKIKRECRSYTAFSQSKAATKAVARGGVLG